MLTENKMDELLKKAYDQHSSDVHICSGIYPVIYNGPLVKTTS